jgi:hypothetical protein
MTCHTACLQVSNLGHHCVRVVDKERVTNELWVDDDEVVPSFVVFLFPRA